jgi:bifunctional DNA-binding transcriptional regulator/antitoxin component of YhaV-PrlF toxin-antitoxin module
LTFATSKSKSLRSTIPIGIVRQFRLNEGDRLEWKMQAQGGEIVIFVKPRQSNPSKPKREEAS